MSMSFSNSDIKYLKNTNVVFLHQRQNQRLNSINIKCGRISLGRTFFEEKDDSEHYKIKEWFTEAAEGH